MVDEPAPGMPGGPTDARGDPEALVDRPVTDGADVPRALRRAFWRLVAVFNVGLFATAFGAMLVAFRGQVLVGGAIAITGLVSLAYGIVRYRAARDRAFERTVG